MQMQTLRLRFFAFVSGSALLLCSGLVSADPPSRVGRLGYLSGAVSFSPAGENDWVQATLNRPLTTGDRLWTDSGGRAEIQVGSAMVRLNAGSAVSLLNLDDRIAQVQLTQGTLNVRVRRLEPNQVFEVDTPNLAFTLRQPGEYRINVDPESDATTIVVRKGQGEVYGEGATFVIDSRQAYRFTGTDLREYQYLAAPRLDDFDRWASARDRALDSSLSARYVSPDVLGYQDLDANGNWRVDPNYGNVWVPNRVAADWAPYRDGHWAWVDPWGWTWIDDAPWGFAVSHYGRWTNLRGTWGWVPGPVRSRAYYAPALVAFVGGHNFNLRLSSGNVGGVAWFPLAPREVYRPSYSVSRAYFENLNRSNTVINNTVIYNSYNTSNVTNVVYANRQIPGAVIVVPTTTFVQSQPVSQAVVRLSQDAIASAPVTLSAALTPTERSVRGAAGPGDRPPVRVFERPIVARSAVPAPAAGFAAQQPQLILRPGRPLDDTARRELRPGASTPVPNVKVLVPVPLAPPAVLPTPPAVLPPPPAVLPVPPVPIGKFGDGRGKSESRENDEQRGNKEQRGNREQRGNGEQRGAVAAPPQWSAPPRPAVAAPVAAPVVAPVAPMPPVPPKPAAAPPVAAPVAPIPPVPPKPAAAAPVAAPVAPAVKPEPVPAARQTEPRPPVAAPGAAAPPQAQSASRAQPQAKKPQPDDDEPADGKNDKNERKREKDKRKQVVE